MEARQNFHDDAVEKSEIAPTNTPVEVPVAPISSLAKVVDERARVDVAEIERLKKYLSPAADTHEDSVGDLDFEALSRTLGVLREVIEKKFGVDISVSSPSLLTRAWIGIKKLTNEELSHAVKEYNDALELKEVAEQRRRTMASALKSGMPKKGPKPPPEATM